MSAAEVAYCVYRFITQRSQSAKFPIFLPYTYSSVYVHRAHYKYAPTGVFEIPSIILNLRPVRVIEEPRVFGTLKEMARTGVDFDDAFLALLARENGGAVASFDRDFEKLGVAWVEP